MCTVRTSLEIVGVYLYCQFILLLVVGISLIYSDLFMKYLFSFLIFEEQLFFLYLRSNTEPGLKEGQPKE